MRRFKDAAGSYAVLLNDREIGRVRNGATQEFDIRPGAHSLQLSVMRIGKSPIIYFDLPAGAVAAFGCGPGLTTAQAVFRPDLAISTLNPRSGRYMFLWEQEADEAWLPDPSRRFSLRWWDGYGWTSAVCTDTGDQGLDGAYSELPPAPPRQPRARTAWSPNAASVDTPAGWHPDPFGRHRQRWWDGAQWTSWVCDDQGNTFEDEA